jgi:biotin carboxyl carrier protein
MIYDITIDGKDYRLELSRAGERWRCVLDGEEIPLDAAMPRGDVLSLLIDGKTYEVRRERTPVETHICVGSSRYVAEVRDPRSLRNRRGGARVEEGPLKLIASMPGKVVRILAAEKTAVEAGQGVIVVEAMKMQNEIKSPKKGRVSRIVAAAGTTVNAGDVLAVVE